LIMYNSTLIKGEVSSNNGLAIGVPINDIATELGSVQVANMVMLGAYMQLTKLFSDETIKKVLVKFLGERKAHMLDINLEAIKAGKNFIVDSGVTYA